MKLEIELTSEQLQEIKTTYNLTEKPKLVCKSRLRPSVGDTYWFITSTGAVLVATWENSQNDKLLYKIGNVYYSEEEASFAVEKKLITQELKDFALEHNDGKIDWQKNDAKYYICLSQDTEIHELFVGSAWLCQFVGIIYFTSNETAQQAIDVIGKDRLIKYYFGEWEETK